MLLLVYLARYIVLHMFMQMLFLAGNHGNIKFEFYPYQTDFDWDEKNIWNWKLKIGGLVKCHFFQISKLFYVLNFQGLSNMNVTKKWGQIMIHQSVFLSLLSSKYVYFKTSHCNAILRNWDYLAPSKAPLYIASIAPSFIVIFSCTTWSLI